MPPGVAWPGWQKALINRLLLLIIIRFTPIRMYRALSDLTFVFMANYLKKLPGMLLTLVVFLGFNFLLLPFYHFHPETSHSHSGEVSPHGHAGHLHSAEVESIAHALNLHPSEPGLDAKHHHSHSSPQHDSDDTEFSLQNTTLASKVSFQADQHFAVVALSNWKEPNGFRSILYKPGSLIDFKSPDTPKERSPPTRFI